MDRLPTELICLIIQSLSTPSRAAFARCSRRYHDILLPRVYTNVFLDYSGYNSPRRIRSPSFFNTVLRRPELALAVRSLHLDSWDTESDLDRRTDEQVFAQDTQFWLDGLDSCITDTFLALSMPRFANLRRLGIEYPYGAEYFNRFINTGVVDVFPHLEELFISWYDTENGIDAYRAIPFFSIPSLIKVSGSMVRGGAADDARESGTRFSNVTDIDLDNSAVSDGLSAWINSCRELRSFRYMHGGGMISWDDLVPSAFGDTLRPHAASLERLWIEIEPDELENGGVDESEMWIGSLENYTTLKILGIPPTILLDMENVPPGQEATRMLSNVLPRSLTFLCLTNCPEYELSWLSGQLEDMLRVSRCPDLSMLVVQTGNTSLWETALGRVRDLCEEAGVGLRVRASEYMYTSAWPFYSAAGLESVDYGDSGDEGEDVVQLALAIQDLCVRR
ncbi:hypothetical protein BJX65DRAFT_306279 [Aspergillus insuetus]